MLVLPAATGWITVMRQSHACCTDHACCMGIMLLLDARHFDFHCMTTRLDGVL
jgi:hypothetical protein